MGVPIRRVMQWLESTAPLRWAESWDNVGLLLGDAEATIERVMTCLTITSATVAEAIERGAGLVVCHHPILYRPAQRLVEGEETRLVWRLARAGLAVYSAHTAYDNAPRGINARLAEWLGLASIEPLRRVGPGTTGRELKLAVFCPESDWEEVLGAACEAGAGRIGAYEWCSFSTEGEGTFRGLEGSNPSVGERGRLERVAERKLELVCPLDRLAGVLSAIRRAHSYEEPAIDVYCILDASWGHPGAGRVGTLREPEALESLARRLASIPGGGSGGVEIVGNRDRKVKRVAIVCGAGDDFVADAAAAGAEVLVTGEARYHRRMEAIERGAALIAAHLREDHQRNIYYWYYATQLLHNLGGPDWKEWNPRMRDMLVAMQTTGDGCDRGSWHPSVPSEDAWGRNSGRLYQTSLSILTLEVYYRYLPLYKDAGGEIEESDDDPDAPPVAAEVLPDDTGGDDN